MFRRAGVQCGVTPNEVAAEPEVVLPILLGSQELHDDTLIPACEDQPLRRSDLARRAAVSAAKTRGHARLYANVAVVNALMRSSVR